MGIYTRRRSSQFNSRLADNRRVKNPNEKKKRQLDECWRDFCAIRARFRHGEASLEEVEATLRDVNRVRRHLHLPEG